jgi:hypothetical protein
MWTKRSRMPAYFYHARLAETCRGCTDKDGLKGISVHMHHAFREGPFRAGALQPREHVGRRQPEQRAF